MKLPAPCAFSIRLNPILSEITQVALASQIRQTIYKYLIRQAINIFFITKWSKDHTLKLITRSLICSLTQRCDVHSKWTCCNCWWGSEITVIRFQQVCSHMTTTIVEFTYQEVVQMQTPCTPFVHLLRHDVKDLVIDCWSRRQVDWYSNTILGLSCLVANLWQHILHQVKKLKLLWLPYVPKMISLSIKRDLVLILPLNTHFEHHWASCSA